MMVMVIRSGPTSKWSVNCVGSTHKVYGGVVWPRPRRLGTTTAVVMEFSKDVDCYEDDSPPQKKRRWSSSLWKSSFSILCYVFRYFDWPNEARLIKVKRWSLTVLWLFLLLVWFVFVDFVCESKFRHCWIRGACNNGVVLAEDNNLGINCPPS